VNYSQTLEGIIQLLMLVGMRFGKRRLYPFNDRVTSFRDPPGYLQSVRFQDGELVKCFPIHIQQCITRMDQRPLLVVTA